MISPEFLGELINRYSLKYTLTPEIVAAVVLQESNGNPFAHRYEDGFFHDYLQGKTRHDLSGFVPLDTPNFATELRDRAYSWGLMQVMGDTARWCFKLTTPDLTCLLDPEMGMDAGCCVLAHYLEREKGSYPRALSSFNAGSPNSVRGVQYAKAIDTRVVNKEYLRYLRSF